jgi:hypothetical protein
VAQLHERYDDDDDCSEWRHLSLRIVFRAVTPFRLLYPEDGGTTPDRSSITTCQNTAVFIITTKRTTNTAHDINVFVLREGSTSFVIAQSV